MQRQVSDLVLPELIPRLVGVRLARHQLREPVAVIDLAALVRLAVHDQRQARHRLRNQPHARPHRRQLQRRFLGDADRRCIAVAFRPGKLRSAGLATAKPATDWRPHRFPEIHQRPIGLAMKSANAALSSVCLAATPIAIASATIPSIRPVALLLSSLRFPAGSDSAIALAAWFRRTG